MKPIDYNDIHRKNVAKYERQVRRYYNQAIDEIIGISYRLNLNSNGEFFFRNYTSVNKKVNKILEELYSNVYSGIVDGVNNEWQLAVDEHDKIALQIYGKKLAELPAQIKADYLSTNGAARRAFLARTNSEGLKLSDNIWKLTKDFKQQLELSLEVGIGKGRSAAALSRDVRVYLNDPDKLFRRVRDENGVLRLSKAARNYSPGRGKYRSSYKNALRLTRNETNFAYESSKKEKREKQDFIVAIDIKVSPNHNPSDDKGGISCISLQGRYSKDFDFTRKWHTNCFCGSFNVLKTVEELDADLENMLNGGNPILSNKSKNAVNELPKNFTNYAKENKDKFANWKRQPYWLDNIK